MIIEINCPRCGKTIIVPLDEVDNFVDLNMATMVKTCRHCKAEIQIDTICSVDYFDIEDEEEGD